MAPVKRAQAASIAARSTCTSRVCSTSPSASPVLVRLAQLQRRAVGLVGIQADLRELGRGAEAQRQQAGGQRVERAGVAGLLGAVQPLGLLQRVVARQAQRLVEQQHAVHGTARRCAGAAAGSLSRPSRAWRWPWRSARSARRRARWCGRSGSAASARCGSAAS